MGWLHFLVWFFAYLLCWIRYLPPFPNFLTIDPGWIFVCPFWAVCMCNCAVHLLQAVTISILFYYSVHLCLWDSSGPCIIYLCVVICAPTEYYVCKKFWMGMFVAGVKFLEWVRICCSFCFVFLYVCISILTAGLIGPRACGMCVVLLLRPFSSPPFLVPTFLLWFLVVLPSNVLSFVQTWGLFSFLSVRIWFLFVPVRCLDCRPWKFLFFFSCSVN